MSPRVRNAKAFAPYFRDALVTRASRRAVRRLGRALTIDEHMIVRLTVRSVIAPAPRKVAR